MSGRWGCRGAVSLVALLLVAGSTSAQTQNASPNRTGTRDGVIADAIENAIANLDLETSQRVEFRVDSHGVATVELGDPRAPRVLVLPSAGIVPATPEASAWCDPTHGGAMRIVRDLVRQSDQAKDGGPLGGMRVVVVVRVAPVEQSGLERATDTRWNFPVRWSEARSQRGTAAGPYPASHPAVRRLLGWLHGAHAGRGAAAAVVVGSTAARTNGGPDLALPAGSVEAYCAEQLGLEVRRASAARAARSVLSIAPALAAIEFGEFAWRRLGTETWQLDVVLTNTGGSSTGHAAHRKLRLGDGLEVNAIPTPPDAKNDVLPEWRWVGCGRFEASSGAYRLTNIEPRRGRSRERVRVPDLAPGERVRLRMFVTRAAPEEGESSSGPAPGAAPGEVTPTVTLRATSPRIRPAVARSQP